MPAQGSRPVVLHPSPAPGAEELAGLVAGLRRALEDAGPALLPLAAGAPGRAARAAARADDPVDPGVALLLATSGSTGEPKVVELPAAALLASARGALERLGGPGRWLLALPPVHVAAWQVLVRSALADAPPVVLDPGDTAGLPAAVAALGEGRRYTSLVPTQLARALADPAAASALASLDAVLLGGAAAPAALLALARSSGVRVVTTYGSTETSGGCVYDGVPLPGARARLAEDGRVLLGGDLLARGYRDPALDAGAFIRVDGQRWFATSDAGELGADGRWRVLGRVDDVLVTGGRKVAPAAVEAVLGEVGALAATLVVGVPDAEWGQRVVALAVPQPGAAPPPLVELRALVADRLGAASAPRELLLLDALPLRGIGKPDRAAAAALAADLLGRAGAAGDRPPVT